MYSIMKELRKCDFCGTYTNTNCYIAGNNVDMGRTQKDYERLYGCSDACMLQITKDKNINSISFMIKNCEILYNVVGQEYEQAMRADVAITKEKSVAFRSCLKFCNNSANLLSVARIYHFPLYEKIYNDTSKMLNDACEDFRTIQTADENLMESYNIVVYLKELFGSIQQYHIVCCMTEDETINQVF
jgi:hypothetical protein